VDPSLKAMEDILAQDHYQRVYEYIKHAMDIPTKGKGSLDTVNFMAGKKTVLHNTCLKLIIK
jgi:hypothetical protein